jgi:hypothetical protein
LFVSNKNFKAEAVQIAVRAEARSRRFMPPPLLGAVQQLMCYSEQKHAVFRPWRVRMHLSCHQLPLQAPNLSFSYGMNEIRYLKSHSVADLIAESQRTSTRNGTLATTILWKTDTASITQPVVNCN